MMQSITRVVLKRFDLALLVSWGSFDGGDLLLCHLINMECWRFR